MPEAGYEVEDEKARLIATPTDSWNRHSGGQGKGSAQNEPKRSERL